MRDTIAYPITVSEIISELETLKKETILQDKELQSVGSMRALLIEKAIEILYREIS